MEIANSFVDINTIKPNKASNAINNNLKDDAALRQVCNDFEAYFMNQLLSTSLKNTNIAGEGAGSDIIKGMYTDAISQSSSGNMGISEMLFKFLSENKS
jgi:Rod binding domain-containing protein